MHTTFTIATPSLTEFTLEAGAWAAAAGVREGLLTPLVRHSSASLLIQENADPDVRTDFVPS